MEGYSEKPSDPYHEELVDIEQILDKDSERVQDYIDELLQLGLEVRSSTEGLIDFPGVLEGKPVYLCWKFGEPGVEHWHDIDKGFAARQRIAHVASADLN